MKSNNFNVNTDEKLLKSQLIHLTVKSYFDHYAENGYLLYIYFDFVLSLLLV